MSVELRPARENDALALLDLLEQLGYPGTGPFLLQRMRQLADHPDALLQVAEADGVVVGFVSVHFIPQLPLAGDFCRIGYLCVDARVRSLGLGAQLESFAEAAARGRGCDRIELHSSERRTDAHRFYRRQGYRESPKYLVKALQD